MSEASAASIPDALLGSVYETLSDPSLWPSVVRDVTAWTGGTIAALQTRRLEPELAVSMISSGIEPAFHQAYLEHHYRHDPHLERASALKAGQTLLSREVLADADFRRTAYYNEYCRPRGVRDLIGVMLLRDEDVAVSYATYAREATSLGEQNRARLKLLVPHLTRVVRLTLRHERSQELVRGFQAAGAEGAAVIVRVDRALRLHSSSSSLERWLGRADPALYIAGGRLLARGAALETWKQVVSQAFSGRVSRVMLADGTRALVTPAPSPSGLVPPGIVNVVLIPRDDVAEEGSPALSALPTSLRRVAQLMARGAADKEIASELGMTLASARTYAARVLKRLGARSRRELMRRR